MTRPEKPEKPRPPEPPNYMREPFLNTRRLNEVLTAMLSKIRENPEIHWRDTDEGSDLYTALQKEVGNLANDYHILLLGEVVEALIFDVNRLRSTLSEHETRRMLREHLQRAGLTPEKLEEVFKEDSSDPPA